MRKGISSFIASIIVIAAVGGASPAFAAKGARKAPESVPGEMIVKLRGSAVSATAIRANLEKALGAGSILAVRSFQTDKTLTKIRISKNGNLQAALSALRADPSVAYAEPNYIYHRMESGIPNDPELGRLWGIHNTGQNDATGQAGKAGSDVRVVSLWEKGVVGNRKMLVAVIDTGIDYTHPDLEANIYTNPGEAGELATNGIDDDANGFIDDVHGWNFEAKTNQSKDDHNHGTHCAGTIGGVGNNGKGAAGVNWEVSLLPVKFLSASGSGTLEDAVESINYARIMKVNVMSNSWGGGGFSQAMQDAIVAAKDAGILFVAAAGNDGSNNDSNPTYPAGYEVENVVAVAATDNQDKIASFSNYGTRTVHVAAPGVKVYSTTKDGRYDTYSGTSMATPHVAGVAALVWSAFPELTFAQLKERLIKTSDPVRGLRRKVAAKGRVNADSAYHNIIPPSPDPDEALWKDEKHPVESAHPYKDNDDVTFTVSHPGAKFIRLFFDKVDVEANYDKVMVIDGAGEVVEEVSGQVTNYMSDYVKGDTATIRLKADESNTGYGFNISRIQIITE